MRCASNHDERVFSTERQTNELGRRLEALVDRSRYRDCFRGETCTEEMRLVYVVSDAHLDPIDLRESMEGHMLYHAPVEFAWRLFHLPALAGLVFSTCSDS